MQCTKLKTYMETGRVVFLPPGHIRPNPSQPRTVFSPESIRQLAESIRIHGVLQPLSVRRMEGDSGPYYQLIAGERRFRAAQLAGLREIPCIVMRMDDRESGLTALMENLQRQDLSFVEEARAYSRLMSRYSMSQEQVAKAVGKSQSAVANKLRLLRHSPAVLTALLEGNLTERHGRALLKLEDECQKLSAISYITRGSLSVAQTEAYIDSLLTPSPQNLPLEEKVAFGGNGQMTDAVNPPPPVTASPQGEAFSHIQKLLARIRRTLQKTDLPITVTQEESPTHITLTLTLPKHPPPP